MGNNNNNVTLKTVSIDEVLKTIVHNVEKVCDIIDFGFYFEDDEIYWALDEIEVRRGYIIARNNNYDKEIEIDADDEEIPLYKKER